MSGCFVLCACICINIHIWVWLYLVLFAHITARHPPATTALCRLLSQQLAMQRIWKTFVSFKNQTLSAWEPLPPRASDMSEYEHHCIYYVQSTCTLCILCTVFHVFTASGIPNVFCIGNALAGEVQCSFTMSWSLTVLDCREVCWWIFEIH